MTTQSQKQRRKLYVLNRFGCRCAYCGCKLTTETITKDHVVPNKCNDINNLYPSCQRCNTLKANLSLEDFRKLIASRLAVLKTASRAYKIAIDFGLIKVTKPKPKAKFPKFWFETYNEKQAKKTYLTPNTQ